jgi:hypothetical protein
MDLNKIVNIGIKAQPILYLMNATYVWKGMFLELQILQMSCWANFSWLEGIWDGSEITTVINFKF